MEFLIAFILMLNGHRSFSIDVREHGERHTVRVTVDHDGHNATRTYIRP